MKMDLKFYEIFKKVNNEYKLLDGIVGNSSNNTIEEVGRIHGEGYYKLTHSYGISPNLTSYWRLF